MRLRWTLVFAFIALATLQLAVVAPLALRSLSALLAQQQEARVDQLMITAQAEVERLRDDVKHAMDELALSQALEDVARDAARAPTPAHVTAAAEKLMTPRGLDVLALLDDSGRTLSSGHLPARIGEPDDPLFPVTKRTGVTTIFVTHSVEEAVLLADRVLVMSAGPGRIDSDFRIELARPRDVSSPEFNALRRDIARRLTSHLALARA